MTSDKARVSVARRQMGFVLGEKRVSLKKLKPTEFDAFLGQVLRALDLREFRGFKSLVEHFSRGSQHNPGDRRDPTDDITVSGRARLVGGAHRQPFDFKTHILQVSRGVLTQTAFYRRNESGEETTDYRKASSWSNGGYIFKLEESILVLRRPSDHSRADENLFVVRYVSEKVPFESRMEINLIEVVPVPISRFRAQFGSRYSSVAQDLIWELRSIADRTLDALRGKADAFRPIVAKLDLIGGAIME